MIWHFLCVYVAVQTVASYGLQLQVGAWNIDTRVTGVSCISVITVKYNTFLKSLGLGSLVFWSLGPWVRCL